ncbi:MAG TPA: urease accessory protein UreH [Candidatus Binatia bacterium]|nr:urease accessory protein UreH [Candidatus Binatia bacterium]
MPTSAPALLALGFVLGLRHALDVDHLAAVSTIVSERRSAWSGSIVGALWGLGHTAALLVAGLGVVALHREIPPAVARALELGVACMLVGLGLGLLRTLLAGATLHVHAHGHGGRTHVHPHVHAGSKEQHDHGPRARRPFLVGLVHGLAGSAALMLAVLATIPSPALAMAYVAVFGAGSIGGMMAMSTLLGLPFHLAARRAVRLERWLRACAAVASVAVGLVLAWQVGVDAGLLV